MAPDEKHTFSLLAPLPTYDEATSSRPSSSTSHLGPEETSDDAERQGLLAEEEEVPRSQSRYIPPTVESERSSIDSLDGLGEDEDAEVRREMQEMDIDDPADTDSNRSLLSYRFKRFTSFTNSFQSLSLPSFRRFLPSWRFPSIDWHALDNNRAVILGRLFGIIIIGGLIYLLIASDIVGFGNRRNVFLFKPEVIRKYVSDHALASDHTEKYLQRITQFPHDAGTEGNYVLGQWVEEEFKAGGLHDVHMERFDVYLNYPTKDGRRLAIVAPEDQKWDAQIEEINEETLVFFGHSASGDVTGHLIFANNGRQGDFDGLVRDKIAIEGSIVLIRHTSLSADQAEKVKLAQRYGAVGCVIYTEAALGAQNDHAMYPEGSAMPEDAVQRGSVSSAKEVIGDVLSPGFASLPGENHRIDQKTAAGLPQIPSLPISWRDAKHLLASMKGQGKKVEGAVPAGIDELWTGDDKSVKVNLKIQQDEVPRQPIYNVLGHIPGLEQRAKRIIVGNHRDSWCSGAVNPGSGTAVMLEVIRIFGKLQNEGWAPLRTIEFASWDGGAYNLIGSTEHVEGRLDELRNDAIAYINIDAAVGGTEFRASGSPLLQKALKNVLARVFLPGSDISINDSWNRDGRSLEMPGNITDSLAFQDIAGVSSIDIGLTGHDYPRDTCYDNYDWMLRFGDPHWVYHKTMAITLAYLILELSDHALIMLDIESYSKTLHDRVKDLDGWLNLFEDEYDISSLNDAVTSLDQTVTRFTDFDNSWHSQVFSTGGFESSLMGLKRLERNARLEAFEKTLLSEDGIAVAPQFKHVVFGSDPTETFPSIRYWSGTGDREKTQEEIKKVAERIQYAADQLTM